MAKTYILEPTELSTEYSSMVNTYRTLIAPEPSQALAPYGLSAAEHYKNGDKVVLVINDSEYVADEIEDDDDGSYIHFAESATVQYTNGEYNHEPAMCLITSKSSDVIPLSSATFAIYYEEKSQSFAEKAGLPEKNFNFEYRIPENNGIISITKALLGNALEEEAKQYEDAADLMYNPGYGPMERLVRAVVMFMSDNYNVELPSMYDSPYDFFMDCAYGRDYPNDLERIAAVIRGDLGDMWTLVKKVVYNETRSFTDDSSAKVNINIPVTSSQQLQATPLNITVNGETFENVEPLYDGSANTVSFYRWYINNNSWKIVYQYPKSDITAGSWYIEMLTAGEYSVKIETTSYEKRGTNSGKTGKQGTLPDPSGINDQQTHGDYTETEMEGPGN